MISSFAEWILPPKIKTFIRGCFSFVVGFTKVDSWETAERKSVGYESVDVLSPLLQGTTETRVNLADSTSVTSRYQQVATAMFFCLSENRLRGEKPLRVLDFGGGGGDYFYQFQKFVPNIIFDWTVVETPALAEAMQQKHGGDSKKIRWVDSIEMTEDKYELVLCSSVLQYLEKPFEILEALVKKSEFVIINRIPLTNSSRNFVALQRVLTKKKRGSYPAHFFSENIFLEKLSEYGSIPMRWLVIEDQPVVNWRVHTNQGLLLLVNSHH